MKRPVIIDVEASGLGRGSYPIEVGVALASGETHDLLIKPLDSWTHWSEEAENLHGLSREELLEKGLPAREVALQLNRWLSGEAVYCDAWANDSSWLALLFYETRVIQHFKLNTLRSIISEAQLPYWESTKRDVFADLALTRHHAADDCKALQECYIRSRSMAESSTGHSE